MPPFFVGLLDAEQVIVALTCATLDRQGAVVTRPSLHLGPPDASDVMTWWSSEPALVR